MTNSRNAAIEVGDLEALNAFLKDIDDSQDVNAIFRLASEYTSKRRYMRHKVTEDFPKKEVNPLLLAAMRNRSEMIEVLFKHGFRLQGAIQPLFSYVLEIRSTS